MFFSPEYVAQLSEADRWQAYESLKAELRNRALSPQEYQRAITLAAKELEL